MELIARLIAAIALLAGSVLVLRHVIVTDLEMPRRVIVRRRSTRARSAPALKRAA
jgi:hypothetical protein